MCRQHADSLQPELEYMSRTVAPFQRHNLSDVERQCLQFVLKVTH